MGCGGYSNDSVTINVFCFRSIASEQLDKINAELEGDVMIRAIHDVKGIDMGNSLVRYKVYFRIFIMELSIFVIVMFTILLDIF